MSVYLKANVYQIGRQKSFQKGNKHMHQLMLGLAFAFIHIFVRVNFLLKNPLI